MQSAAAQIVTNIMTDEIDTNDTSTDEVCSQLGDSILCYECFGDIILNVRTIVYFCKENYIPYLWRKPSHEGALDSWEKGCQC